MDKIMLRPELNYPFADLLNPFAKEAESMVEKWIDSDYQAMPEVYHEKKRIISTGRPLLAG